jgi:molybdate transport system substrate-binding protein
METMMRRMLTGLAALWTMMGAGAALAQAKGPLVLAAASLQESLTAAADAWAAKGHAKPTLSFAASSALARQIDAGSPADLFISADEPWMDDVQKNGKVKPGTRTSFLANTLVLVAPATAHGGTVAIRPNFPLAKLLGDGRLAMADPDAVPAGKYGKASLTALGVWPQVQAKVAPGDSVRAALAYVERGQTPYGIVYGTDAKASKAVKVVGTFPEKSHAPITYPIATLTTATSPDAEAFRAFLISGQGKTIFRGYGFVAR